MSIGSWIRLLFAAPVWKASHSDMPHSEHPVDCQITQASRSLLLEQLKKLVPRSETKGGISRPDLLAAYFTSVVQAIGCSMTESMSKMSSSPQVIAVNGNSDIEKQRHTAQNESTRVSALSRALTLPSTR